MSIFTKVTLAKAPKTSDSQKIAYFYAFILVIFVLSQLFTYDDFLKLLDSFLLPGGTLMANVLGAVIVISELFALPFLLRMSLSPLMRVVSIVLGWMIPLIWLKLSLWSMLTTNNILNIGFFGTVIDLVPGWWAVFFSIALGILAVWASWGLWPFVAKSTIKTK